jgi:hypothetical protein
MYGNCLGLRRIGSIFVLPAAVATILDFIPATFPFFAPTKGQSTGGTGLFWQVFFFDGFHVYWI